MVAASSAIGSTTFIVNSTADGSDALLGDGLCGTVFNMKTGKSGGLFQMVAQTVAVSSMQAGR
jgi:hypothetical protein